MSQPDGYSKCVCKHCGGRIEFPSEGAGRTIPCPHCGKPTALVETNAVSAKTRPRWVTIVFAIAITVVVVLADVGGVYWYHSRNALQTAPPPVTVKPAPPPQPTPVPKPVVPEKPPPDPWHGLTASAVKVENKPGSHLVYAVGKLHNASDHQRFGVKVELDVFDADHEKLGTATDYTSSIDPGKDWTFRALVTDRNAKSAKITAVTED